MVSSCYLYRHIRVDKNEPFYIGIAHKNKQDIKYNSYTRSARREGRNSIWNRIVAKTQYEIEILFDNLTWEEACVKEIEFIKLYGRIHNGTGTLANLTSGGEGVPDHFVSDNTKHKISVANTGRTHTEETKLRMSNSAMGKNTWTKGRCKPRYVIEKQIRTNKERGIYNAIRIVHTITGIVYSSFSEVSRLFNIPLTSLKYMLQGKYTNKTSFKILDDDDEKETTGNLAQ